ncbi:MAG: DUF6036 family nucleotidyltransferase [Phycisphaeraceae bacterium]
MPQWEGNDLNFRDMLYLLRKHKAEFLLIGAHAMAVHDVPRATGDIDFWVRATPENATRVYAALIEFGAPLSDVSADDFAKPGTGLHIGLPPGRIDILTQVSGLVFERAWQNKIEGELYDLPVYVLGASDFVRNKRASGRDKDLKDIERLLKKYPDA